MTNSKFVKKVFDLIGTFVTDQFIDGRWLPVRAGAKVRLGVFDDFHKARAVGNSMLEGAKAHSSLSAGYANGKRIKDVKNAPGQVLFVVPDCAAPINGHRDFTMERFSEHQSVTYLGRNLTRDRLVSVNVIENAILTRTGWGDIVQTSIARRNKRPVSTDTMTAEKVITND